jgi:cupin 2 domain-containing protein
VKLPPNLFDRIAARNDEELFTTLLATSSFRIERIESHGHASPPGFWYEQATAEWVLVVSGSARLEFEGDPPIDMPAGAYVNIPPLRRHRVVWTDPQQPTIWLAIHYLENESK